MAKHEPDEQTEIFLGQWLDFFGMSVTEAARVAGCKQSYISNIIANRKTNVNVLYLLRISEALSVNVNDFYRRSRRSRNFGPSRNCRPRPKPLS
jgi:plasmid maintenance system antidote protein VapI